MKTFLFLILPWSSCSIHSGSDSLPALCCVLRPASANPRLPCRAATAPVVMVNSSGELLLATFMNREAQGAAPMSNGVAAVGSTGIDTSSCHSGTRSKCRSLPSASILHSIQRSLSNMHGLSSLPASAWSAFSQLSVIVLLHNLCWISVSLVWDCKPCIS